MSDQAWRALRRPLWSLTVVLLACSVAMYALAGYVESATRSAAEPLKARLSALPVDIAGFHGKDVEMASAIVEELNAQDYVKRLYTNSEGDQFSIYVGYFDNLGIMKPHNPEVCYPGAGWEKLYEKKKTYTDAETGESAEVHVLIFGKRGLRQGVVTWFLTWGGAQADVGGVKLRKLRLMMLRRRGILRVQLAMNVSQSDGPPPELGEVVLSVNRELEKLLPDR